MWLLFLKKYAPYLAIISVVVTLSARCWYLDATLKAERASNQAYRAQQAALAEFQKQQNKEALEFANGVIADRQKESDAQLAKVLTQLNKTVAFNEELNDALTLSRTNVERLRDYVRSFQQQSDAAKTIEHPESGGECNGTVAEDVRSLIAACAKTTIDFNKCKQREELVCSGRFPVECTGALE